MRPCLRASQMARTPQKGHKGFLCLQVPSNHSLDSLIQTKDRHGTGNIFIHPADCMVPSYGASLVAQKVKSLPPNAGDAGSIPGSGRSAGGGNGNPLQDSWASLVAQLVKNPPGNAGYLGSILGWGRSPGGENGNPLQDSCLENPMDRGAWWAIQFMGLQRV